MTIKLLDLGGTATYESPDAVGLSLDGTMSEDEVTPVVIGDYNVAPFAAGTFEELFGCCALEDTFDLREAYRLLAPGGKCTVSGCMDCDLTDPDAIQELFDTIAVLVRTGTQQGFEVHVEFRELDGTDLSYPFFDFVKPAGAS
jgi:hypothetical protein